LQILVKCKGRFKGVVAASTTSTAQCDGLRFLEGRLKGVVAASTTSTAQCDGLRFLEGRQEVTCKGWS